MKITLNQYISRRLGNIEEEIPRLIYRLKSCIQPHDALVAICGTCDDDISFIS